MIKTIANARTLAITLAGGALLASAPASAEIKMYEDYEVSDSVYEMVTVDIDAGEWETYLENLRATWVAGNEVAKRLGHIEDYAIYTNMNGEGEAFDLLLVIKFAKTSDMGPSKERYAEFMTAYGAEQEERGQRVVRDVYNKIRRLTGSYHVREVTFVD